MSGSTPIGADVLTFEVEQSPVTDWTFLLGTNIEYRKHLSFVFEGPQWQDVYMVLVGAQFRF